MDDPGRTCTVQLGSDPLTYHLRRTRRRSIGLVIRDEGLLIQAPLGATRQQIESAISHKAAWIRAKLQARDQRLARLDEQARQWREGGRIAYLGTALTLKLTGAGTPPQYLGNPTQPQPGDRLCLPLHAATAHADIIQQQTQAWLRQRATAHLGERLAHYVQRSGQPLHGWGLSSAHQRWGACSHRRTIRLNWRLIQFEPALIDYVVAHEVAHLRHMNHGAAFWQQVEQLYPDYRKARALLSNHCPQTPPLH